MQDSSKDIIYDAGIDIDDKDVIEIPEIASINKEMKKIIISSEMSREEIRSLVNSFYQHQDIRITKTEQLRSLERGVTAKGLDPSKQFQALRYSLASAAAAEKSDNELLKYACQSSEVGKWLMEIVGMGPALSAGCLAYFDVTGINYASNFISYAGLNDNNRPWLGREKSKKIIDEVIAKHAPGEKSPKITSDMVIEIAAKTKWKYKYLQEKACNAKGKWDKEKLIAACAKIPYNKSLKTHMWKIGKSFEYQKSRPKSLYGRLLAERIVKEMQKNEAGEYRDLIQQHMSEKNYSPGTDTYKAYMEGMLPQTEINARSRRWVQKIFISHLFEEMYRVANDKIPPRYYTLEHCDGHHDEIPPEVPYTLVTEEKNRL